MQNRSNQVGFYDGPCSLLVKGFVLLKTGCSSTLIANPFFGKLTLKIKSPLAASNMKFLSLIVLGLFLFLVLFLCDVTF